MYTLALNPFKIFSRSHAPAWERIIEVTAKRAQARKYGTLARPKSVPTPARGNQKSRSLGTIWLSSYVFKYLCIMMNASAWERKVYRSLFTR